MAIQPSPKAIAFTSTGASRRRVQAGSPSHQQNDMLATERQHLAETMSSPPMQPLAAVLKCAACLAFLFLLVVIGNSREGAAAGQPTRPAAARVCPSGHASEAEAHRKEMFGARGARFTAHPPDRDVAE